jgi:hypothetical protein
MGFVHQEDYLGAVGARILKDTKLDKGDVIALEPCEIRAASSIMMKEQMTM